MNYEMRRLSEFVAQAGGRDTSGQKVISTMTLFSDARNCRNTRARKFINIAEHLR